MAYTILKRPLVTEKSTRLRENNSYVLEVDPSANKHQIRAEVESRFKVNVIDVHTVKVLGKFRRRTGPVGGYQPNRKKAIVRVKDGQQIKWEEVA
jgi:large subunit ribosomal protein L23